MSDVIEEIRKQWERAVPSPVGPWHFEIQIYRDARPVQKSYQQRRRELIEAGALIVEEIIRLDRAALKQEQS